MTSGDGLEREMWGLHLEGFSVREIAREVGCSRSTVHRVIQRLSAD
jgi:DNA-directed RNA polymerase specialized sigma24 family protein